MFKSAKFNFIFTNIHLYRSAIKLHSFLLIIIWWLFIYREIRRISHTQFVPIQSTGSTNYWNLIIIIIICQDLHNNNNYTTWKKTKLPILFFLDSSLSLDINDACKKLIAYFLSRFSIQCDKWTKTDGQTNRERERL